MHVRTCFICNVNADINFALCYLWRICTYEHIFSVMRKDGWDLARSAWWKLIKNSDSSFREEISGKLSDLYEIVKNNCSGELYNNNKMDITKYSHWTGTGLVWYGDKPEINLL